MRRMHAGVVRLVKIYALLVWWLNKIMMNNRLMSFNKSDFEHSITVASVQYYSWYLNPSSVGYTFSICCLISQRQGPCSVALLFQTPSSET